MPPLINATSVTNNVAWSVLSKTGTFGLKFVTVPILARILSPAEFGVVAVALTVVQFLAMIGGAGLAASLVVQREEDMQTVHSVFWANFLISCLMALALYIWAAPLAALMGAPDAAYLIEIMCLLVPIQLGGDVAYALLARRMQFSKDALWSMISESLGAIVAVTAALMGWGVWALVIQLFVSAIIRLAGLFAVSHYFPRLVFSPRRVVALGRFSIGVMGSEIANFITFQSPMIIIARALGLSDAGIYSAANRFASIPNQIVLSGVMGVLFPAFSQMLDDRQRRSDALILSTQVTTVLLAPMMFGLWAVAKPAMLVIFGSGWATGWPVLGLLAFSKAILTPCSTFIPYLKGVGRSDILFWSAFVRAAFTAGVLVIVAITGTLTDTMLALCFVNAVTLAGYSWAVFKVDGMPVLRGVYASCRPMLIALIMAVAVRLMLDYAVAPHVQNAVLQVLLAAAFGTAVYMVLLLVTERALLSKLAGLARARRAASPVAGAP